MLSFVFSPLPQTASPGLPGLPPSGLLAQTKVLVSMGVHPIRVTQFAQRADLELIDPGKREPADGS
jgi:hypothetical protein